MSDWKRAIRDQDATLRDAISQLDEAGLQIVLVVRNGELLGTVTDGDIRRALLRGIAMDTSVTEVMNTNPITVHRDVDETYAANVMREHRLHHLPVLDEGGKVVDLLLIDQFMGAEDKDAWVVLMAGGLGTRLHPLTQQTPKPLLNVGGKPLLATIVEMFVRHGFRRIFLSLNYRAELFREQFGDGARFGARIEYLHETEQLGTAGALSLLPEKPNVPIIVMNGDVLTSVDFASLLLFHMERDAAATMCIREHSMQVPYGVARLDGDNLVELVEKPHYSFFINAGIYVLSPEVLDMIPGEEHFDMTDLFDRIKQRGETTCVFPVREYWLDIGRIEDLERARMEYKQVFSDD